MSRDYDQQNTSSQPPPGTTDQEAKGGAGGLASITLPKGGGAIKGIGEKFAANPVTGTGTMTIPLPASPGRSGFGPHLTLSYDSGSGNGSFGFGWSLSLPAVTRKTDKGLPQYMDAGESDVFILSGAEDLVPVLTESGGKWSRELLPQRNVGGEDYRVERYRPRIEGAFVRVERWTSVGTGEIHWRSISRDNITTVYGADDNSRIFAPDGSDPEHIKRVFSWLICRSYDDKGNAIVYEYATEDDCGVDRTQANERNRTRTANRYPKRIKYGNKVSRLIQTDLSKAEWMFEVVFDYEEGHYEELGLDASKPEAEQHRFTLASASPAAPWAVRPDPFSSYRAGFEVRTYRRCRRVLMFHHFQELDDEPYLVRSTEFDYADLDYAAGVKLDDEMAHEGSTRIASFIVAALQSGFVRDESRRVLERGGVKYLTYLKKSLPPVEFGYSRAKIQDDVRELDAGSLENLPVGLDGSAYQWVDLDGEGVSGILTEQAGTWFYKASLGGGRFGPLEAVTPRPSLAGLRGDRQQLLDLAGDGQLDAVSLSGPTPGFYERTDGGGWEPFTTFDRLPNIRWDEPNLRFVDLNGDGRADVLITEDEVFTWYESLGEKGFGAARRVRKPADEEKGPHLVFADDTQSIYLADMCGDGLTDLVRIRNGEVAYWPNLGYGRFGAKVTMDDAPRFDNPDQFSHERVRLADIDGSGTTDIIYLGRDGTHLYFNQSGNRWSGPRGLPHFPQTDNLSSVMTADLLGNGTACLVWSSPLPGEARRPTRYVDLMGGQKPHLLVSSVNNLGAETRVEYAPSTKFYLADKLAGKPWITRLPFPVHVIERVETYDRVSGNRFVTRHAYHHGHFDGEEREFQGFGMVEQWDTEEFAALAAGQQFPAGTNVDASSHVPPTLTRTWFHTGVYLGRAHVSVFFAGLLDTRGVGEYYREPGLTDAQTQALLLEDTVLPDGWTTEEEREACRALKGSMLRQEVYALDGTDKEPHPYSVAEQNLTVRRVQPKAGNRHGVFFTHPCESLSYHYERDPSDPRTTQALTLAVDEFGNVTKEAAVSYGRRVADTSLPAPDRDLQTRPLVIFTEHDFTNAVNEDDDYRTPIPCETRSYELTGLVPASTGGRFTPADLLNAAAGASRIGYEQSPTPGLQQKRLIEHVRTLYRDDDLTGPLSLGKVKPLALPYESYKLAFTSSFLAASFGGRVTDAMLDTEARYVHSEGDADWWIPSGRFFYSTDSSDKPAQELSHARAHFFLPRRYQDPFHTETASTETLITYDAYDLLPSETLDPLGNRVTAGNDYRVLQPGLVTDPNGNRTAVAFDALGMMVGTALTGKAVEVPARGDQLTASFRADLTTAELDRFFADPKSAAGSLLDDATTRVVYDLTCFWRAPALPKKRPAFTAALARETHASDPAPAGGLRIQIRFSYSDGFGREIQKKAEAEAGPVPKRAADGRIIVKADGQPEMTARAVSPRWVGSGWMVFNNKGKPVRQFEPFFTDTHGFESDVRVGVSPVFFYDPVERVVATLHPDHTWEKVVFGPWRQETCDVNDTVAATDPGDDPDVGALFRRLPQADYLPTWDTLRRGGALGQQEKDAARKAAVHADTPFVAHLDPMGRSFLTVAHNKFQYSDAPPASTPAEEFYSTTVLFDIEGNQRGIVDALGRTVVRYDYDMLGTRVGQVSSDAGERRMLNDVAGKSLYRWDGLGRQSRTTYDVLRRPVGSYLLEGAGAEMLVGRTLYGETRPTPEAGNLRGKIVQHFDQAGVVTTDVYDFKGNVLRHQRQFAREYKSSLDWSAAVPLESAVYTSLTSFDALNRPTELTTPDKSVVRPTYNEANRLERLEANVRGDATATAFVTDIDYDAKGQRTLVAYGNGVTTAYIYDPQTFRLSNLLTRRDPLAFPGDCPPTPAADWPGCEVQNLTYTYDPAGNITHILDAAQQTVYFNNRRIEPSVDYTYDALYRLIEATGRELLGLSGGSPKSPTAPDAFDYFHSHPSDPRDGSALGTYLERYAYDGVGNILSVLHRGSNPSNPGWRRCYQYAVDSNRLLSTGDPHSPHNPDDPCALHYSATPVYAEHYQYDAHGNMTRMPHLPLMLWGFGDRLQATSQQAVTSGTPETTRYVYDSEGRRARKVTESQAAAGHTPTRTKERLYLGDFEIYREYEADGTTVKLERETLHVMDDRQRIALVETRTDTASPEQLVRYQLSNHLGSSALELDDKAQLISYEEYYPYGGTSYQTTRGKTAPKRYRYTGKERDEESGLYYHGARYYAAWLGRWTSCDPLGVKDGVNIYAYVHGRPTAEVDPTGRNGDQPWWRFTEAGQYYEPSKHDMFQQGKGVDTGFAPTNLVVNTLIGVSNLCTIPFNLLSRAAAIPEETFRAMGASEQDVEALNFGLMMTGVGEVAALPKVFNAANEVKTLTNTANEVKSVTTAVTEAKNVAGVVTETKNVAGALGTTKKITEASAKVKNAATAVVEANNSFRVSAVGRVALDNNAIVARLEGLPADVQAVVKAMAGRKPSVSITAVKEFLAGKKLGSGKGDIKALRAFLIETGGGVGKAPSAATVKMLRGLGVDPADAQVVGSAIEEGIQLLTTDGKILKKVPSVAKTWKP